MVEIVLQGYYGIINLTRSSCDDLFAKSINSDLVVDFRTHTHCMKSIKSICGLSSAMHWHFKSSRPNSSHHSPLPPAFGRSANPPGPFCRRVVCYQSSCCSSSSLAHLLHCVNRLWCELTCCLSLWYLHCYLELWTMIILTFLHSNGRDSSFKLARLTLSANYVLSARKEQCSYRVLPCPSLAEFLMLSAVNSFVMLLLCHQLTGFWLKLVVAPLCGIIHC